MRKEIFQEQKKQAKNLLLDYTCGSCRHFHSIVSSLDGNKYNVCKIWYKDKIIVDKDLVYMDDNICHYFEEADEISIEERKICGDWKFKRNKYC